MNNAQRHLRPSIQSLAGSQIREVVNSALDQTSILKFWFGESDEVTHPAVREAAIASLQAGETFYAANLGLFELREAVAAYMARLHGSLANLIDVNRIAITSGGVSGLMLATQSIVDAGDEVVCVTPIWPNLPQQARIMGARVQAVSLYAEAGEWKLNMHALCEAITPATKLLLINAPNNPTGWTLTRCEQQMILDHCRTTGTWIVADEVYERLYYEPMEAGNLNGGINHPHGCAPSFLDIALPEDRLIVTHSFSKSFLMTGWRLGWLVVPPSCLDALGKLIEFNTSCAPSFVQRAALEALKREAEITPPLVAHFKRCRDTLIPLLQALPHVQVRAAKGGMYAFFKIEGFDDSLALAKRLVAEAKLGLAPGCAFELTPNGAAGGWMRWCFASQDVARLTQGVLQLRQWLEKQ
ncbi:MAG: pyridoxal phosphate-dependent aminotransferase [Cytophagales bacterium]|nr:pyridoxal phosphate-dependent aminotransferase [Cytophagales bacterium]